MTLSGKKIILGITGSIAAYKAAYLLRRLVEDGADVKVVMTREAVEFVSPLTYEVLSNHHVYVEMFDSLNAGDIAHLNLGREADAIVVAPATANIIGKMANGICDDLLSTILVGIRCPVIMAPAMDYEMYESPVVQKNISLLKELKVEFTGPDAGPLASGASGQGRMSEPEDILYFLRKVLSEAPSELIDKSDDLEGACILVTAGPTREA
ncbi:MAG: bifunctional phosphopantothenoylcysteine decarboxylase/phosphopantothenate--cysteine ligase CoaBC, partial [Nitrospira sp.]|nr:bifunctional phosphopantothenoylcysteine decarboxylase/phosphopantothenate--cysteine ligase CoaBC [Nitrospira sp.]